MQRNNKGFTLIELLVVIAIIAILAAILFPVFAKARAKARQATCVSNEKQIGLAVMQYVQDYDETYPISAINVPGYGWVKAFPDYVQYAGGPTRTRLDPYIKSRGVWYCPEARIKPWWTTPADSSCGSYGYNYAYLENMTLATVKAPSDTVLGVENIPTNDSCPPPSSSGGFLSIAEWRHNDGMNVLWADGHVKWLHADDANLCATDDRAWNGNGF